MRFEHLVEINDPLMPLLTELTREQLWRGLVLRADDPTRFMLYEVYRNKEAFAKHQTTEHYFRWRDAVTEWMAQPRQGAKYAPIFYGDSST